MVLGAAQGLNPLAVRSGLFVHVLGDRGGADEGDRLDAGVGQDRVHCVLASVHHVEHAVGQAGLPVQAGHEVGGGGVALARLEDERVAGRDGDGVHPKGHHRGEVERGDARDHAERLAEGVHVDAARDLVGEGALQHVAEAAGELDDLAAAGDLAAGVVDGLAVFGGDDPPEFLLVLHEQLAEGEHHLRALGERGLRPALEGRGGGGDGGVDLRGPAEHDTGLFLSGGRVEDRLGVGAGDRGAVDPVGNGVHGDGVLRGSGAGGACGRRRSYGRLGWNPGRRPR